MEDFLEWLWGVAQYYVSSFKRSAKLFFSVELSLIRAVSWSGVKVSVVRFSAIITVVFAVDYVAGIGM